jgi:hypothetical protein
MATLIPYYYFDILFVAEFGLVLAEIIVSTDSPVEYRQVSLAVYVNQKH